MLSLMEEQQKLLAEIESLKKEKTIIKSSFEDKLQVIKEENDRELNKLGSLLESSEAEKNDQIHALQEKQQKLKELEEYNNN